MQVATPTDILARQALSRWQDDPVAFAQQALGMRVWARQAEFMRAVATYSRVAVRSGHKTGKSRGIALLAYWWALTRDEGRVIMTSSGNRQVKSILWREIKAVYRQSRLPIGGKLNEDPATGLQLGGGREVIGFTTKEKEKMAGFSGKNLLFILDEASGIPEDIHEAIDGNRAGGAKIVMLSNPTQTSGTFYEAFTKKRALWHTLHISSTETPNCTGEGKPIPGLATPEWVKEKQQEYGGGNPDEYLKSPFYQVRVLGDFPTQSDKAVISLGLVTAALDRWPDVEGDGPLEIGVDVARFGDDDSVICARRGLKALPLHVVHGMNTQQVADTVRGVVREHRAAGERVRVKVDVIGVGAGVADELRKDDDLEVLDVNVAEKSTVTDADGRELYVLLRDELWFGARDWLRAGGAIAADSELESELTAPLYDFGTGGRAKVESKDSMKKRLGRSPDRADALCLAVYQPPRAFVPPEPVFDIAAAGGSYWKL